LITEDIAESRSLPSSPGTHDGNQLRNTPSNLPPSFSMAPGQRHLLTVTDRHLADTPLNDLGPNARSVHSRRKTAPWPDQGAVCATS